MRLSGTTCGAGGGERMSARSSPGRVDNGDSAIRLFGVVCRHTGPILLQQFHHRQGRVRLQRKPQGERLAGTRAWLSDRFGDAKGAVAPFER